MKLIDALDIVRQSKQSTNELFEVSLVCGFTPLHLQSFLHARLQLSLPDHRVQIAAGAFNDIPGTLRDLRGRRADGVALVLEWADLDPRLGTRQLGGWGPGHLTNICARVETQLAQLQSLLEEVSRSSTVVVSLPTLPLPPLFFTGNWQSSHAELKLRELVAAFAAECAATNRIRLLNSQTLDLLSPPAERLSVKSDWQSGFPYQNAHAAALAGLLAQLLVNPLPKKGLITDLDDTLWRGIVGEVGAGAISWDLDRRSQAHGLYQQFLHTLAEEGVLIGVASKNEPAIVEEAFGRDDLLLAKEKIFPIEVSWGSKAQAVARILSVWNVAADSVVFVDDNPLELVEVKAQHPGIECLLFSPKDESSVYDLIVRLRDLFGKSALSDEEAVRAESLRARATLVAATPGDAEGFSETLLEQAEAELTFRWEKDVSDTRALELLNKTSQFNLNGKRLTEAMWRNLLAAENSFLLTVSYKDRFGALGKIGVLAGRVMESEIHVEAWVMSCRAFARRIEHQSLRQLFEQFRVEQVTFDYAQTPRNQPLANFFSTILSRPPEAACAIERTMFEAACPKLYHRVIEVSHAH
ncbi:hypothetical protein BH18ACI2_BH18ACI2_16730 [soil metagenome]